MQKSFKQAYAQHEGKVSDKWSLYLNEWDGLFLPYRAEQIQLLEIGVQNGGSLEIWSECFPRARNILGCDIDPKCAELKFNDPRITIIVGDANQDEVQRKIVGLASSFDIIIDDGSHHSADIVRSFGRYFSHVKDNGIYVIEDIHTSYWEDYGGGLNYPLSAIEFFKRLADIINFEHWRNNKSRVSWLANYSQEYGVEFDELCLARIHSIEFINSICVIKKMQPENNVLGKRIVAGTEESVVSGWKKYDGTLIHDLTTDVKDYSDYDVFDLVSKNQSYASAVQELTDRIQSKEQNVNSLQIRIDQLNHQVIEKEEAIRLLSDQCSKREKLFLIYADRIMNAEQTIRQLTSQVIAKTQADRSYEQQAQELAEIKSSHAWRLVKLIWQVRSFLRPR